MRTNSISSFCILLSVALTAIGLSAADSPRFRVDTREREFRILDVKSAICSGEYGASQGHAYFPARYRGSGVEFTFTVEASEDVVGYVYSDSPTMTSSSNTRQINLAGRSPGFSLTVVGVDKDGRETAPFRANFDIVELSFAEVLQCVEFDGDKCKYKGEASFDIRNLMSAFNVKLPCVEIKGEPKKTEDNTQLGFFGNFHAAYEFCSDGTATLSAGGGDKANKGDWTKWGKAFGMGMEWSYGGLLTYLYNGRSLDFNGGGIEASFGGSIESPSLYWPGTPVYVKGELGASGSASIVWNGQQYVSGDFLSGFEVTLGADIPKIGLTAGVGSEDLKVAAGAKGEVALHGEFDPFRGKTTAKVNAPVAVQLFAKAFWLEIDIPVYSGTLDIYPRSGNAPRDAVSLSTVQVIGCRDFRRLAPSLVSSAARGARSSGTSLLENIPDRGSMCTAPASDGGIEALYLADEVTRACADSATLYYAHVMDGALSGSTEKIWDDGTADFHPSVSAGTDGKVFAAWTNIKRAIGTADAFEPFATNAEIAVAIRSSGAWSCQNLTDDAAYDAAPSVAASPDGAKALVVWSRNEKPLMYAMPESSDELRFSVWNGSDWSTPAQIPGVRPGSILSGETAYNGTQGVYVYSVNPDFDGGCQTNVQLYATTYDGSTWSTPQLLAEKGFGPYDIHVWYSSGDDWSVVWNCGGSAFYRKSSTEAPVKIGEGADMALGEIRAGARVVGLTTSVAGTNEGEREIAVAYLDSATDGWSFFAPVTSDGGVKSVAGGIRAEDGKLKLLYRVRTDEEADDYSKICYAEVSPVADVDFVADGMSVAERFYDIGSNVTIKVKMQNRGLLPSGNLLVSLTTDSETLGPVDVNVKGGEVCEVSFPWTVRTLDAPTMFRADASNGRQMLQMLFKPDLEIDPPELVEGIGERYLRARLRNRGLPTAPVGTLVEFHLGDRTGQLIGRARAGKVQYGVDGLYDVSVIWPSSVCATAAKQLVTAVVDPNEDLDEFYRDNNSRSAYVRSPLDTDGDGLVDDHEEMIGTDPTRRDTDGDGLSDYEEVIVHHTCPTVSTYTVTFDLGRYGQPIEGQPTVQLIDHGGTAHSPEFTVDKSYVFIGWDRELPETITCSLTLKALYIPAPRNLTAISTRDPFAGAAEYLGWINDASGGIVGSLSVKVAKAGKDGMAKAKATVVRLETGRKTSLSDVLPTGALTAGGTGALAGLTVTATGIGGTFASGEFAGLAATAVLNQSKSKDPTVTATFAAFKDRVYNLSMLSYGEGCSQPFARGHGTLSIAFAKSGKAKVSGFLPDGSKLSASAQLLLTKDGCCLPVIYSKSGKSRFAFALWFDNGAKLVSEPLTNVSDWKTALVANDVAWQKDDICAYEPPTSLAISKFSVEAVDAEAWFGQLIAFPSGVPLTISPNLKKWDAGKAASLKLKDGVVTGADDPTKPNLTGLKLTFTPKNGSFKGSFSAVSLSESGSKPKLVKGKATVNGVLVGRTGYGTAVIKKTGSMPATVK